MPAPTERVPLQHVAGRPQFARLREPTGEDELSLDGVDTRSAVQFLDRLCDRPVASVSDLSASDRDRILAALHRALWGDRIVSTLDCDVCGAAFDLGFEISALQRDLHGHAPPRVISLRIIADADGAELHLPNADEEQKAAELGPAAGAGNLTRIIGGEPDRDTDALSARLETLAPLIDIDLDVACAECGHHARARFDIQSFVLQRLLDERDGVIGEIHALASGYGWSLQDILSLPRGLRRSFVNRIAGATSQSG